MLKLKNRNDIKMHFGFLISVPTWNLEFIFFLNSPSWFWNLEFKKIGISLFKQ
jgi:hypothetical protein